MRRFAFVVFLAVVALCAAACSFEWESDNTATGRQKVRAGPSYPRPLAPRAATSRGPQAPGAEDGCCGPTCGAPPAR